MNFIRLISCEPGHAFYNMALDEALSESVRNKRSPPTLRLYTWDRPSLSLGYFQKISDINLHYCEKKGYPIVRRQTGGRAVLHDAELTYSFTAPNDSALFRGSLLENYTVISNALLTALELISVQAVASYERKRGNSHKNPACFKAVSFGEITVDGKKIIGSAHKRYRDGFLQHGSILMRIDYQELCNVLGLDDEEELNAIGALRDHAPEITAGRLEGALKEAFEKTLKVKLITDVPSKFELSLAKELERTKYSAQGWNFSRKEQHSIHKRL